VHGIGPPLEGLHETLIRRRDYAGLKAEVVEERPRFRASLSKAQPFHPAEAAGYFLAKASAAELVELRRGGYALLLAVEGEVVP
jgi:hypothetical protein